MLRPQRCGDRIVAIVAVSAALFSGCANPVLDRLMDRSAAAPPVLSANVAVSLSIVRQEFPMMTRLASTGTDPLAPGMPRATRRSQFTDPTAMGRIIAAVAEYVSADNAYTAFADLEEDFRSASGSVGLGRPDVGQDALATIRRPTFGPRAVTIVAREDRLIVQVTSNGFKYSREHFERLSRLAQHQMSRAVSAVGTPG